MCVCVCVCIYFLFPSVWTKFSQTFLTLLSFSEREKVRVGTTKHPSGYCKHRLLFVFDLFVIYCCRTFHRLSTAVPAGDWSFSTSAWSTTSPTSSTPTSTPPSGTSTPCMPPDWLPAIRMQPSWPASRSSCRTSCSAARTCCRRTGGATCCSVQGRLHRSGRRCKNWRLSECAAV